LRIIELPCPAWKCPYYDFVFFKAAGEKALSDYELLEGFNYNLSNEDYNIR